MGPNEMIDYFEGKKLIGDDMTIDAIAEWYKDEKEAYAKLKARAERSKYKYAHHGLNRRHGFRYLPKRRFSYVLGFGSAYGDEFKPVAHNIENLTIVEPSDVYTQRNVHGIPTQYIKPEISGTLPFKDNCFDLIVCLGALHHLPNVSYVLGKFYRCMKPKAFVLIREPIVSMGDWRKIRSNLTRRERGIPIAIFRNILDGLGFKVIKKTYCVFLGIPKLFGKLFSKSPIYNNILITVFDEFVCRVLRWNITYHPTTMKEKFMPSCVYYVLFKQ